MKRFKNISILLFCFLLLTGFVSPKKLNSEQGAALENLLTDGYSIIEENTEFVVIGKNVKGTSAPVSKDYLIEPNSWLGYSLRNLRLSHTTPYLNILIRSASINRGTTYEFKLSHTRATTVSGSLAIGASDVNVNLGYERKDSVTLTDTFTYTCPGSYSRCEVNYYPNVAVYYFDEYFLDFYQSTHEARVLSGFYQTIKFYR